MQSPCSGCNAPCIVLKCEFSVYAVDAVSHKMHAVCCDRGCSAHEGGCSLPAVIAVPTALSWNVDAIVMLWMQCPTRWMQYVVMEDAGPINVDAVMLQWLQWTLQFPECGCSSHAVVAVFHKVDAVCCDIGCSAHEGGCSDPAVAALPSAVYVKGGAVLMQRMQCPSRWMSYVVMEDVVPT